MRAGPTRAPALWALGAYVLAALVLLGRPLLHAHECVCYHGTSDAGVMVWALAWWPHALAHGLNPFHPDIVYAPQGINIAHGALIPGAALLLAPVTALAGPLFAFNLAMVLCPALAAFFAFGLCRRLTGAFWPSLLGGWVFGFSTYMFGQLLGHLVLTLVFLVPAIVHIVLRGYAGELSRRRFVVLLTAALVLQFSFNPEVLASGTIFGAIAAVLAFALGDAALRGRLRALLPFTAIGYALTVVLVSPYLYYALKPGGLPVLPARTNYFSNDLLSFVVPNEITKAGGGRLLSTSRRFTAGFAEGGGYLGVPLLVMVLLAVRAGWRRLEVRIAFGTLLAAALLSLGGRLHVRGASSLPLPWGLVHRLPIVGLMLPARFAVYVVLAAGVLAAMWLATTRRRLAAWGLALVAVGALLPAVDRAYWHGRPTLPAFFTTSAYRRELGPRDTALVLPVGIYGQSMLWQAEAHLGFRMASGYVIAPEAPDPYKQEPIFPALAYDAQVPHEEAVAAAFLRSHHITVVILQADLARGGSWLRVMLRLGWRARKMDGVILFRPA